MKVVNVYSKVKEAIIHPFAFAVFPVLSLYVKNVGKGFFREAIGIATGVFIFAALLWLFVGLFIKDRKKSAIVVSAFFVLFFSYGHAISAFSTLLERMHLLDKARFLVYGNPARLSWLVVWGILFIAVSYFTARLASDLRVATKFLNIMALALVVMVGVGFLTDGGFNSFLMPHIRQVVIRTREVVAHTGSSRTGNDEFRVFLPMVVASPVGGASGGNRPAHQVFSGQFENLWLENLPTENATLDSPPDIYYIILDMHIRLDYLEEIYHYDASEFLSFLTDKEFYVASKSRSNYPYTTHSLASSLNFMYINEIADQVGQIPGNRLSVAMIQNSRLIHYLRNHGYTIVTFATGYWFTEIRDADVYVKFPWSGWHPGEFQKGLVSLTPLSTIPILRRTQDDIDRARVLYPLDHIADGTEIDSPTFVFAHIIAPHDPFVFGPNGESIQSQEGYTHDEYVEAYRNQVAYVDKKIQQVIEEILSQSPQAPIIIVQGDHGTCYGSYDLHIAERTSILNVYYFPDQNYEDLYEDITPVNTFRIVLNNYFGADYELLEDKCYFSSPNRPYLFIDVTDDDSKLDHYAD